MRLILIGASGHGKVCAEIAELSGRYREIFFLDDDPTIKKCGQYDVVGTSVDFYQYLNQYTVFFVSIGAYEHRKRIQEKIEAAGGIVTVLLHKDSVISDTVTFEAGTVVMPGAVVNAGTKIGKGVIVNTSSSIDHDCMVGDWSHIAVGTHICGTVHIGYGCWIGAGAVVINNVSICDETVIGAGAVVIHDVEKNGTYIGIPAKKIIKKSRGVIVDIRNSGGGYYDNRIKAYLNPPTVDKQCRRAA